MSNVRAEVTPALAPQSAAAQSASRHAGYLFHPAADFLLAGGGSLIVAVPVFWLIRDKVSAHPTALTISMALALFVNFPHFAHSYQLLYAGIARRILGAATTVTVRLRYIWAGFVAPVLIAVFLGVAYWSGDPRVLGFAANAFWFTTGWHYVKQGYGVVNVLSAVRRMYFSNVEKKLLLINGYVVWIYSWLAMNAGLRQDTVFNFSYVTLDVPAVAIVLGRAAAIATSIALAAALAYRVIVKKQPVSWNGVVGYASSLYLWVIAFSADPIFTLFVPAFHSLQYMLFVWRYALNKVSLESDAAAADDRAASRSMRLAKFGLAGLVLGFIGFIALPVVFQSALSPDPALWGPAVFTFIFTAFINLHHYFIDNVIWRRDNEDVRRFLFAAR